MRLELNAAFHIKVAGENNSNGTSRNIANVKQYEDAELFARNVDILKEMVDLWNAKHAPKE